MRPVVSSTTATRASVSAVTSATGVPPATRASACCGAARAATPATTKVLRSTSSLRVAQDERSRGRMRPHEMAVSACARAESRGDACAAGADARGLRRAASRPRRQGSARASRRSPSVSDDWTNGSSGRPTGSTSSATRWRCSAASWASASRRWSRSSGGASSSTTATASCPSARFGSSPRSSRPGVAPTSSTDAASGLAAREQELNAREARLLAEELSMRRRGWTSWRQRPASPTSSRLGRRRSSSAACSSSRPSRATVSSRSRSHRQAVGDRVELEGEAFDVLRVRPVAAAGRRRRCAFLAA